MICLAHMPAEDAVALPAGSSWRESRESVMLGPSQAAFLQSVITDRRVTAAAMVRSAVQRSTLPEEPIHAEDHEPLRASTNAFCCGH